MENAKKIRNVLLLSFVILFLLNVVSFWLYIGFSDFYNEMFSKFFALDREELIELLIPLWGQIKIIGIFLFLIPAISIHFVFCREKK